MSHPPLLFYLFYPILSFHVSLLDYPFISRVSMCLLPSVLYFLNPLCSLLCILKYSSNSVTITHSAHQLFPHLRILAQTFPSPSICPQMNFQPYVPWHIFRFLKCITSISWTCSFLSDSLLLLVFLHHMFVFPNFHSDYNTKGTQQIFAHQVKVGAQMPCPSLRISWNCL